MTAKLDIVGHFGTTFSYATVGSRVADALAAVGCLGTITNLDPEWHSTFARFRERTGPKGSHVLLFTAPNHYVDGFARIYGRERSALFMSPNTDRLAKEHAQAAYKFGLLICPSRWCEEVTRRGVGIADAFDKKGGDRMPTVWHLPLGVDEALEEGRYDRISRIGALSGDDQVLVMHFSSDQSWPGRKGTEPLLFAWSMLSATERERLMLRLHLPPALMREAMYMVRELQIDESVDIVLGAERGSSREQLVEQFNEADAIVAPSRCEGFGIMLLSALVAGVPLVCTAQTGPFDYLRHLDGWIGVATAETGELAYEEGQAPVVEPRALLSALRVGLQPRSLALMATVLAGTESYHDWLWPEVLPAWVERLTSWMEER